MGNIFKRSTIYWSSQPAVENKNQFKVRQQSFREADRHLRGNSFVWDRTSGTFIREWNPLITVCSQRERMQNRNNVEAARTVYHQTPASNELPIMERSRWNALTLVGWWKNNDPLWFTRARNAFFVPGCAISICAMAQTIRKTFYIIMMKINRRKRFIDDSSYKSFSERDAAQKKEIRVLCRTTRPTYTAFSVVQKLPFYFLIDWKFQSQIICLLGLIIWFINDCGFRKLSKPWIEHAALFIDSILPS